MVGGCDENDEVMANCVWFDDLNQKFDFFGNLKKARTGAGAMQVGEDFLYVFSGVDDNKTNLDYIERHNFVPGTDFEHIEIKNQKLIEGQNFLSFYKTPNDILIFGNAQELHFSFNIAQNSIEQFGENLDLQDTEYFSFIHSGIKQGENYLLVGDDHIHKYFNDGTKTSIFTKKGVCYESEEEESDE